jgi:hypothetical protein
MGMAIASHRAALQREELHRKRLSFRSGAPLRHEDDPISFLEDSPGRFRLVYEPVWSGYPPMLYPPNSLACLAFLPESDTRGLLEAENPGPASPSICPPNFPLIPIEYHPPRPILCPDWQSTKTVCPYI